MDTHLLRPRPAYGTRRRLLLQRPGPPQVRTGAYMAVHDEYSSGRVSVVLLGLQSSVQSYRQLIHR